MTYNDMWRRLAAVYTEGEAKAMARMLMEEHFGMTLADILCGAVEALPPSDAAWTEQALRRLEAQEPIQYVLGHAWFGGNRLAVRPGVLIPRPETEWLVDEACRRAASLRQSCGTVAAPPRILDIGTGSGCIAISIKKRLPQAHVHAWDISPKALGIAAENARLLHADVAFGLHDALDTDRCPLGAWDIIVSNPPYICRRERAGMEPNVLAHEPHTALFVPDDDPLLFYRAIAAYATRTLRPGGSLLFECNTLYARDTAGMMRAMGMAHARAVADCFGKPRFATAEKG